MHKGNILIILCLLFLSGVALVSFLAPRVLLPEFSFEAREVVFEAKIASPPDERSDKTILILQSLGTPGVPREEEGRINGKVWVSTDALAEYKYGEHVVVEGTLEQPEDFSDFSWRGYLAKEDIKYVMYRADLQKTGLVERNLRSVIVSTGAKLTSGLQEALLPPHSSLYSAMMLGKKSALSEEMRSNLQKAGLSHIVAISGMHIAIIALILFYVLLGLGMWRHHAQYATLMVLLFYILMIGAPASSVRAGIMVAVVVLSERLGRPRSSWRALVYAATVMVILNPLIVRYDIGFQLSFLAVAGILLFTERLKATNILQKIPEGVLRLRSVLAMTFSAQAFAFPLVLYHFNTFSLFSPLSNFLVVPILPAALVSGFIAALGGIAGGTIASALAAPAWLFSSYIWGVVNLFS